MIKVEEKKNRDFSLSCDHRFLIGFDTENIYFWKNHFLPHDGVCLFMVMDENSMATKLRVCQK